MNTPSKSSSQGFPMVSHAFPMVSHGFHAETRHDLPLKLGLCSHPPLAASLLGGLAGEVRQNPWEKSWENDGFHVDLSISSRKMDGRWKFKPRKHGEKPDFLCWFGRYLMIKAWTLWKKTMYFRTGTIFESIFSWEMLTIFVGFPDFGPNN